MNPFPDHAASPRARRVFLRQVLIGTGAVTAGCRNPDVVRVLMEGPEGSGIMGGKVFAVLGVYLASERQKAEAEAAARDAERRLVAAARAKAAVPIPAEAPAAPPPPPDPTPAERAALPATLAVKVTEERAQGAAAVMLWNTRSASLANANVYDLKNEPPAGKKLTWKTSVASVQAVYVTDKWPN